MKNLLKMKICLILVAVFTLSVLFYNSQRVFADSSDFRIDESGFLTEYLGPGGDVVIPDGVRGIGYHVFIGNELITSITIPKSVTYIEMYQFNGCENLANIYVDGSNPNYSSEDGVLFTKDKSVLLMYPIGNKRTYYYMPDEVTVIGNGAFSQCNYLTDVVMSNNLLYIGENAFELSERLTSVYMPDGVRVIGKGAFSFVNTLADISIPKTVSEIGEYAFLGCFGLTRINVNSANEFYSSDSTTLFNKDKTQLICYAPSNEASRYNIPRTVIDIKKYAFNRASNLLSVTIPKSVRSIEEGAFFNCQSLSSISIPSSVTSIGRSAFANCEIMNNVNIAGSGTVIETDAFLGVKEGITMYGKPDSSSEAYAKSKNIQFIIGDVNTDYKVDINDVSKEAEAYNAKAGNSLYDEGLDYNNDRIIDIFDIVLISREIE